MGDETGDGFGDEESGFTGFGLVWEDDVFVGNGGFFRWNEGGDGGRDLHCFVFFFFWCLRGNVEWYCLNAKQEILGMGMI